MWPLLEPPLPATIRWRSTPEIACSSCSRFARRYWGNPRFQFIGFHFCLQGVGRRYASLVCKKADVDMKKRAGELTEEEVSA